MNKIAKALFSTAIVLLASATFATSPLEEIERAGVFPGFTLDTRNSTEVVENKELPLLVGVVITENVKKAILFDKGQKKRIKAKEGEEVSGFKVEKILPDSVVLEKGGKSYTVKIFTKEAAPYRQRFSRAKFARTAKPSVVLVKDQNRKAPTVATKSNRVPARKSSPPPAKTKRTPPTPATTHRHSPPSFIRKFFGGNTARRRPGPARSFIDILKGLRKR